MLQIICVEQPEPKAGPDVCPVVSLGTLPLTCVDVYACVCGWLSVCPPPHTHAPFCYLCVWKLVPRGPFNSVSISSFTWGSWWWSGTRATLPTQHQKLLMSYCCTLLWNIIALWCVNKAGACCHSICSPAGQTGTTSQGRRRWGGSSREQLKRGFWSAGDLISFAVEHNDYVDGCLCADGLTKFGVCKISHFTHWNAT